MPKPKIEGWAYRSKKGAALKIGMKDAAGTKIDHNVEFFVWISELKQVIAGERKSCEVYHSDPLPSRGA